MNDSSTGKLPPIYTNPVNEYEPKELENLCTKIQEMSKINQVEILRIFHNHNKTIINENRYGVHINMTDVSNEVLESIESYINYVNKQEKDLTYVEEQQHMNEKYNLKGNKENIVLTDS